MLHLLLDRWLPIQRSDGSTELIRPCDLGGHGALPPQDLIAIRPDFRAGLYQLLIGLLQTACAPADENAWRRWFAIPPSSEALTAAFAPWESAFALENDGGAAFAQDLDPLTAIELNANLLPMRNLLIDAGSDSNSFFNKPSSAEGFCPACTAQALFVLQTNAPAGGRGIRTSVRGGGPLTTLVSADQMTLWQKLWINVLPTNILDFAPPDEPATVMPWLAATRSSEEGRATNCGVEAHPLQVYWGLPRRIRLDTSSTQAGNCALCGQPHSRLYTHYRTRHGGVNYQGAWIHPLSPYNYDAKNEKPPLPLKGVSGGVGYRYWLGLVLGQSDALQKRAQVVKYFLAQRERPIAEHLHCQCVLWACGYKMDNAKAMAWNNNQLPLYDLPLEQQADFRLMVEDFLHIAESCSTLLNIAVREAWGSSASEPAVAQRFWQQSETGFYQALAQAVVLKDFLPASRAPVLRPWLMLCTNLTLALFDEYTASAMLETTGAKGMQQVIIQRAGLEKKLRHSQPFKTMWPWLSAELDAVKGAEA